MPIYEYRRPDGTTFEVVQKFSDEPLATDPESGAPVTRVLHAPAIHFKGSGFHNTDYGTRKRQREESSKKESSSSESSSSSDSSSGGTSSADKKSDAAPAKKDATKAA
jgi:putative FmdB family regulatory protein